MRRTSSKTLTLPPAMRSAEDMHIWATTVACRITLDVESCDSIDKVNLETQEDMALHLEELQRLKFVGEHVADVHALSHYDIQPKSTLQLSLPMLISVQTSTGTMIPLSVDYHMSTTHLKNMIQQSDGIPSDSNCWFSVFEELVQGSSTLRDNRTQQGTTLHLEMEQGEDEEANLAGTLHCIRSGKK